VGYLAMNTCFGEGTPSLTADGRYLLFGSDQPTNPDAAASGNNLYIISTASIMGSD
jgi:Tol biopolymer transport system component